MASCRRFGHPALLPTKLRADSSAVVVEPTIPIHLPPTILIQTLVGDELLRSISLDCRASRQHFVTCIVGGESLKTRKERARTREERR
jgi:hypothetical protein